MTADWDRFAPPWDTLGPQMALKVRHMIASSEKPSLFTKPLKVGALPTKGVPEPYSVRVYQNAKRPGCNTEASGSALTDEGSLA